MDGWKEGSRQNRQSNAGVQGASSRTRFGASYGLDKQEKGASSCASAARVGSLAILVHTTPSRLRRQGVSVRRVGVGSALLIRVKIPHGRIIRHTAQRAGPGQVAASALAHGDPSDPHPLCRASWCLAERRPEMAMALALALELALELAHQA